MSLPQVPNYFGMVAQYGQQPQNPLQEALGLQALQRGAFSLQQAQQAGQEQQQELAQNRAFNQALGQQLNNDRFDPVELMQHAQNPKQIEMLRQIQSIRENAKTEEGQTAMNNLVNARQLLQGGQVADANRLIRQNWQSIDNLTHRGFSNDLIRLANSHNPQDQQTADNVLKGVILGGKAFADRPAQAQAELPADDQQELAQRVAGAQAGNAEDLAWFAQNPQRQAALKTISPLVTPTIRSGQQQQLVHYRESQRSNRQILNSPTASTAARQSATSSLGLPPEEAERYYGDLGLKRGADIQKSLQQDSSSLHLIDGNIAALNQLKARGETLQTGRAKRMLSGMLGYLGIPAGDVAALTDRIIAGREDVVRSRASANFTNPQFESLLRGLEGHSIEGSIQAYENLKNLVINQYERNRQIAIDANANDLVRPFKPYEQPQGAAAPAEPQPAGTGAAPTIDQNRLNSILNKYGY